MRKTFVSALKSRRIEEIKRFSKSDIHNHATRGGNINYVLNGMVNEIPICPSKIYGLNAMQEWYDENVKIYCQGLEGFERRIRAAFIQAKEDGITHLTLSFGYGDCFYYGYDFRKFADRIEKIKNETYPDVKFYPEIAFVRTKNIEPINQLIDEILNLNYFRSIDLNGDDSQPVDNYVEIYKKAKKKGLITKAHVGEFGSAETIIDAVTKLDLDEVQHGIKAVNSLKVMEFLRDKKISLNICPSSNVILNNVKTYEDHPIGKLYRFGIKVTINTDDMLIFNKSLSEEYLNMYIHNVLSAEELNEIRLIGINNLKKLDNYV